MEFLNLTNLTFIRFVIFFISLYFLKDSQFLHSLYSSHFSTNSAYVCDCALSFHGDRCEHYEPCHHTESCDNGGRCEPIDLIGGTAINVDILKGNGLSLDYDFNLGGIIIVYDIYDLMSYYI